MSEEDKKEEKKFLTDQDAFNTGQIIKDIFEKHGFADKFLLMIVGEEITQFVGTACLVCCAKTLVGNVVDNQIPHFQNEIREHQILSEKGENVTPKDNSALRDEETLQLLKNLNPNPKTKLH